MSTDNKFPVKCVVIMKNKSLSMLPSTWCQFHKPSCNLGRILVFKKNPWSLDCFSLTRFYFGFTLHFQPGHCNIGLITHFSLYIYWEKNRLWDTMHLFLNSGSLLHEPMYLQYILNVSKHIVKLLHFFLT